MPAESIAAKGFALSWPAMSGAEPCTGSNRPTEPPRLAEGAEMIERAVSTVIAEGYRTADIFRPGTKLVGTRGMGDAVLEFLDGAKV